MAVGAIFSGSVGAAPEQGSISQDLRGLQKALADGDTSAAQQAFTEFKRDLPSIRQDNVVKASPQSDPQHTIHQDLSGLQNAIEAGDLSGAQEAFAQFKRDTLAAVQANGEAQSQQTSKAEAQSAQAQSGNGEYGKRNKVDVLA